MGGSFWPPFRCPAFSNSAYRVEGSWGFRAYRDSGSWEFRAYRVSGSWGFKPAYNEGSSSRPAPRQHRDLQRVLGEPRERPVALGLLGPFGVFGAFFGPFWAFWGLLGPLGFRVWG